MPSARKKTTPKSKKPRPANPGEAMQLASLHQACLGLHHRALRIFANAPKQHQRISKILHEASAKLNRVPVRSAIACGDGYYDCQGECIPDGQACTNSPDLF